MDDLYDKIEDKKAANDVINSLKICDPAVGSGHFLVSALNEMIAIKSELKILLDRQGKRLKEYSFEVANDELVVTDEDGLLFEYNPKNQESQRVQETLFHEKQTIIENCLFGVDINPNSVKICRLRLWIELLKNAYYTSPLTPLLRGEGNIETSPLTPLLGGEGNIGELETLPNIDINIKCGNSLISRFSLDANLQVALSKKKYSIEDYKNAVKTYRNAENKEQKRKMERLINDIKGNFKTTLQGIDPNKTKLRKLEGEVENLENQIFLIPETKAEKTKREKKIAKLNNEIDKLRVEIEDIEGGKIYENAFEWRFEFPEVLNDDGVFIGFDVVIGNPPYFSLSRIKEKYQSAYFENNYQTYTKGSDIYCLFYEKGNYILRKKGLLNYITSNSWLKTIYGDSLKKYFIENMQPKTLLNIEDIQIFEEATVESNIIILKKDKVNGCFDVASLMHNYIIGSSLDKYFSNNCFQFTIPSTSEWIIGDEKITKLKSKIEQLSKLLKDFNININRGLLTGFNAAFIINEETKNKLIAENSNSTEIMQPILRGRDLKKYSYEFSGLYLINTHNGVAKNNIERIKVKEDYPSIYNYLLSFLPQIKQRQDQGKHWTNLRNCAYLEDFNKPKIIWGEISDKPKFAFDDSNYYAEATTFLMTGEKLKYLLAVLNSKLSEWYFNQISTTTGMGTNRWKKYKIEMLPIKEPTEVEELLLEKLVDQILNAKKSDPNTDTTALETEIDQMVYQLYNLTAEEIQIIESSR
jgi:type II restriction/modification system DNA methylase subunit YeeA